MGTSSSRIRYEQPPVPSIDSTFDLDDPDFSMLSETRDPEGYAMCKNLALREGTTSGLITLAVLTSLSVFLRRRASTVKGRAATYIPGLVFLTTATSLASFSFYAERTLHSCQIARGTYLIQEWRKVNNLDLNETDESRVKSSPKKWVPN